MAYSEDCCYFGRGEVYINDYSEGCGTGFGQGFGLSFGHPESKAIKPIGNFLGNVSELSISPTFERKQKIYTVGNFNAPDCSVKIITGATVSLTVSCTNNANLARAFCGKTVDYELETTEPQEACFKPCNGEICERDSFEFPKAGVDPDSVVITDNDDVPLVLGEDYDVDTFCITFLRNITIPNKSFLKITYQCDTKYTCIDGFSGTSVPVTITYKGCNLANENMFYRIKLHKINLDPIDSFAFINDDFNDLTFTGTLEPVDKESLKSSDVSQWFEICKVDRGAKKK